MMTFKILLGTATALVVIFLLLQFLERVNENRKYRKAVRFYQEMSERDKEREEHYQQFEEWKGGKGVKDE